MLRQCSSECLMTRAENIPRGYPRNYEVHCIKGTYITKCGMVMYHHRIFRWFFVYLLSVICLFTSGLYFAKIRRMFSSIGFAGSSKKNVQHVTLLISSSIKCSAFKYSVFFMFYFHLVCTFFSFFLFVGLGWFWRTFAITP